MSLFDTLIPSASRNLARQGDTTCVDGPVQKPIYEIQENDEAYSVTVYLPGVAKEGLEITAEAGELRIVGRRSWKQPKEWTALYRESPDATYELVLTHDNVINADKIAAELRDGVLHVSLPKAEAVKPRKITIG